MSKKIYEFFPGSCNSLTFNRDTNREQDRQHHNRQNHDRDKNQIENSNQANTQQTMLVTEHFSIGTEIIKDFEEGTLYEGKVVGYRDIYYQIRYEDDDEEELEHGQVYKYLKTRATKETGRKNLDFFKINAPKIDSESFGHNFPSRPNDQCMIITFQNIGPQKKTLHSFNSKQTSRAFRESKV